MDKRVKWRLMQIYETVNWQVIVSYRVVARWTWCTNLIDDQQFQLNFSLTARNLCPILLLSKVSNINSPWSPTDQSAADGANLGNAVTPAVLSSQPSAQESPAVSSKDPAATPNPISTSPTPDPCTNGVCIPPGKTKNCIMLEKTKGLRGKHRFLNLFVYFKKSMQNSTR
jgi:hypothetical protein